MNKELVKNLYYAAVNYCEQLGSSEAWVFEMKFAELIVKEYAAVAVHFDNPDLEGPGSIIADKIESHFGLDNDKH